MAGEGQFVTVRPEEMLIFYSNLVHAGGSSSGDMGNNPLGLNNEWERRDVDKNDNGKDKEDGGGYSTPFFGKANESDNFFGFSLHNCILHC